MDVSRWIARVIHDAVGELAGNDTKSWISHVVGENRTLWTRYVFGSHAVGTAKLVHWMSTAAHHGIDLSILLTSTAVSITASQGSRVVQASLDLQSFVSDLTEEQAQMAVNAAVRVCHLTDE